MPTWHAQGERNGVLSERLPRLLPRGKPPTKTHSTDEVYTTSHWIDGVYTTAHWTDEVYTTSGCTYASNTGYQ